MKPKLTVSGYRGIWGTTLTEEIAREYIGAFAMLIKSRGGEVVYVARDGRESGRALLEVAVDEILENGLDVIDLGMMATPVVPFLIRNEKADGAVIITASHNPIEYNGLKFVTESGAFTTESEVAEIESLRKSEKTKTTRPSHRKDGSHLFEKYLESVLKNIDVEKIRAKHFKAILDPINSVGCTTTPELFEKLGVSYALINGDPTGIFAHEPEPLPKNLTSLQTLVRDVKAHVGLAQDPDGDRLVICDENGNIPSEETMLALCVKAVMRKNAGDIVINLSTSNMSSDIATEFGGKTFRSKVGEANVVEKMKSESTVVIGGEGGGGVIWPTANMARDSYVGIALILELMANENKPLSEIIATLPQYIMKKEKVAFSGNIEEIYTKIKTSFQGAEANTLDGLRLDFPDRSWVHIRPSNTEPVLRIIAESKTLEHTQELIEIAKLAL